VNLRAAKSLMLFAPAVRSSSVKELAFLSTPPMAAYYIAFL
jgi:hypothetical protein